MQRCGNSQLEQLLDSSCFTLLFFSGSIKELFSFVFLKKPIQNQAKSFRSFNKNKSKSDLHRLIKSKIIYSVIICLYPTLECCGNEGFVMLRAGSMHVNIDSVLNAKET